MVSVLLTVLIQSSLEILASMVVRNSIKIHLFKIRLNRKLLKIERILYMVNFQPLFIMVFMSLLADFGINMELLELIGTDIRKEVLNMRRSKRMRRIYRRAKRLRRRMRVPRGGYA